MSGNAAKGGKAIDPKAKMKLGIAGGVIVLAGGWLVYWATSTDKPKPPTGQNLVTYEAQQQDLKQEVQKQKKEIERAPGPAPISAGG